MLLHLSNASFESIKINLVSFISVSLKPKILEQDFNKNWTFFIRICPRKFRFWANPSFWPISKKILFQHFWHWNNLQDGAGALSFSHLSWFRSFGDLLKIKTRKYESITEFRGSSNNNPLISFKICWKVFWKLFHNLFTSLQPTTLDSNWFQKSVFAKMKKIIRSKKWRQDCCRPCNR